ncbi:MAG: prenyltransferase [Actinomycetota bacterium]|nr:prenyltransferase [Actinomycetota bacterium]
MFVDDLPFRMQSLDDTAASIARTQLASGCIPHSPGSIADPWNHIEAAMGLDVMGRHDDAARAYEWLLRRQRSDGAWAAAYRDDGVVDATLDANFIAYLATGVWHHYVATQDQHFLETSWDAVERAVSFVLGLQAAGGGILWARDARYEPWPGALLTSSSCIFLSLRCAVAIAETLGEERPDWELAMASIADAVANRPHTFEPKDLFSMDWYYPVLAGIFEGAEAETRLRSRWDEFVMEGSGARCVSDRPWVTSGETAELILTLDLIGWADEARTMFAWLQRLRDGDGAFWIGATFPDGTIWPREKPTWGSGAVILAADALFGDSATSGFFRGETFPSALDARLIDPL